MTLKKTLKALIPDVIFNRLQAFRARMSDERFKNINTHDIFSEIYQKSLWGKSKDPNQPFFSGSGSHDKNITENYIKKVGEFLSSYPNKPNVVDLGCGDFSVGSQLRSYCNSYVACDIVQQLIEYNKYKYKDLNVDFRVLNLITETLPIGDIVLIRQVLQHLSNENIQDLIPKLKNSYSYLILTEHLPKSDTFLPNLDKPAGVYIRLSYNNSGIILTKPPFNLNFVEERVMCESIESEGVIRTTLYKLK